MLRQKVNGHSAVINNFGSITFLIKGKKIMGINIDIEFKIKFDEFGGALMIDIYDSGKTLLNKESI
jgi:hypothetical protein